MLDTILFASIVAFFKERFGLTGWQVVIAAVVTGSVFWFQGAIAAAVPLLGQVIDYLKFILATPGLFDLIPNVTKQIRRAWTVKPA